MSFTYDPSTDIGRVRRTIPDRVEEEAIFSDEEVTSFITDEGNWRRATALALETIATDQALVLKVVKVQNIQTDGAKLSDALLKRASLLREQADIDDNNSEDGSFEIAQQIFNDFGYREHVYNLYRTE